ncbi:hypothetical protein BGX28_007976 [Mortierella sp. GBA30]|nr:hypothetical protein BGX28_007976 [Mortierella sp. GBA30]
MAEYSNEKTLDQHPQHPFTTQEGQAFDANTYAPAPMSGIAQTGYNNIGQSGPTTGYPGATAGPPTEYWDPTQPRPNDILPLHPAIIRQRQLSASLPPCPKGGYHELRSHQYV